MNAPSSPRPGRRGFTLLEMVITLSIFILLAAAVFGIMSGVLDGTASLQDNQNRGDQLSALNAFLKKKLGDLPAQSNLLSYQRGTGEGLVQNGIYFGQDSAATAIDAKVQDNGYYMLRLAAYDPSMAQTGVAPLTILSTAVLQDESSLDWTPLLRDIKTISWKFQAANSTDWLDAWTDSGSKPNLIEFSLQLAGDLQPVTMDFWLPHIVPISLTIPQNSTSTTPAPTPGPRAPQGSH